jgi:hypothetical protein
VRRAAVVLVAGLGVVPAAAAQRISFGVHGLFADYRELSSQLQYQGKGVGGIGVLNYHKFSADLSIAKINYTPGSGGSATETFSATQVDGHLRWYLASGVSLETGYTRRTISPAFTAQAFTALRAGIFANYGIGPGANLSLRGNYLPGAKFSGGGTAPFALELGLGVSVGTSDARFRVTGDYEFQRVDRKTDVKVPLQQSLARVGVRFGLGH